MGCELNIGNRIKEIREHGGDNQREFAENIGLFSADHLRKIERGDVKEPKYEHLIGISDYSGVSIDNIMRESPSVMPRTPDNLNMSMQTLMAEQAIGFLHKCAQSIKSLDGAAIVGMEYLERERNKFDKELEDGKIIKLGTNAPNNVMGNRS